MVPLFCRWNKLIILKLANNYPCLSDLERISMSYSLTIARQLLLLFFNYLPHQHSQKNCIKAEGKQIAKGIEFCNCLYFSDGNVSIIPQY